MSFLPKKDKTKSKQEGKYTKFRVSLTHGLIWTTAFIFTAVISAVLGATVALLTPLAPLFAPLSQSPEEQGKQLESWQQGFSYRIARPVNILIMGIDRVLDAPENSSAIFDGRSDTMLLVRFDASERALKMLSIPRDTRVDFPGLTIPKINQANVDGGTELAARIVSNTLNNVPIDRYVRVSTGAFRELVDQIGGIEVFVPAPMHYVDKTQNLKIDLEQGWQTLNGDQAEQFARFRNNNNGDIGRVQRQQILLKALRQRLTNPTVLPRLPKIMRVMWKYVDTNLSIEETLALANFMIGLQPDEIQMVMLPGRFSGAKEFNGSYWIVDQPAKDRIMQQFFQQESTENKIAKTRIIQAPTQTKIAIQNATEQPQLGKKVAKYLAGKGFKNVYVVSDWPDLRRQTQIIVEKGDLEAANFLKRVLGVGTIEASSTGDINSEVTIRIGQDWLDKLGNQELSIGH